MKTFRKYLLPFIFLLALILRFWNLSSYPDAIDEDEMALGYYAYSLIKNGSDEYGSKFPIYFESAGDYKYGLYSYLATIPVGVFGLNPFSTRFIAALAGSLSVIAIYFLALEIFKEKKFALLATFLLAINPAHIHFSRVAYNNVLGGLFALFSITFLLRWFDKSSRKNFLLSFLFFVLSIYSYQAYRIFMPTVFTFLTLLFLVKAKRKSRLKLFGALLLSLFIVYLSFLSPKSRSRSQDFSLLINQPLITEYHNEDGVAGTGAVAARLFHNKLSVFANDFLKRYISSFDPVFLFRETSAEASRHSTPEVGVSYLVELPFFLIGLFSLFLLLKKEKKYIPLILLLASPLAASLVREGRNVTREIMIVYGLTIISALGIYFLVKNFKSNLAIYVIIFLYSLNFLIFSHQYLVHKVYHHPWYSDVGLKEMVKKVNDYQKDYSHVVMSHGHYIPYLFYNQVSPTEFISNSEFGEEGGSGVRVKRYNKIIFNMPFECPSAGKKLTLYVCFGYKVPKAANLVDVIRFRDGQPTILLVEFGKPLSNKLPEKVERESTYDVRFSDGVLPISYEYFWPQTQ